MYFKSKVSKQVGSVLLIKVKTADKAIKIKYFYERDVDVTKLVVPIKIKQRGKESVFAVTSIFQRCLTKQDSVESVNSSLLEEYIRNKAKKKSEKS